MYSRQSFFLMCLLAAVLLLAATACSVETREERQARLAAEEQAQGADQTADQAADQQADQEATSADQATDQDNTEPAMETTESPEPTETVESALAGEAPSLDVQTPDARFGTAPDTAPDMSPDAAPNATLGMAPEDTAVHTALEATSDAGQDPAEVVSRFFSLAPDQDLAQLEPLVASDQRGLLPDMLAELSRSMTQEGDQQLLGVDKVDVLQTTRTAVVDVNVTLRFAGGEETKANSIQLRYEDGAWRISKLDF